MGKWDTIAAVADTVVGNYRMFDRDLRNAGVIVDDDRYRLGFDVDHDVLNAAPDEVIATLRDWVPLYVWDQHKTIYTPHPGLSDELMVVKVEEFEETATISGNVLRYLPHPDPLYVLPEPVPMRHVDDRIGQLVAFVVCGGILDDAAATQQPMSQAATSTTDDDIDSLRAVTISEVFDDDGVTVTGYESCHLAIPLANTFTISQLVSATLKQFVMPCDGYDTTRISDDKTTAFVTQAAAIVITHLLYTVSKSAEIAPPRRARQRASSGASRPRKHVIMPMGYQMGAQLRAWRQGSHRRSPGGSGRTMPPHLRRAHFHTFRYGPGRRDAYIDFLPPIPVNLDGGKPAKATIHPYK